MKHLIIFCALLLAGLGSYAQSVASPTNVEVQVRPVMCSYDSVSGITFVELADANQTGTVHIRVGTANGLGDIFSGSFELDGSGSMKWNQHLRRNGNRVVVQLGFLSAAATSPRPLYVDARIEDANGNFSAATSTIVQ